MFKPKLKHRLLLSVCIAILAFSVSLAQAYIRPNNPTMDYVPQNVGIYDTNYSEFKESDCRACHGTTTAWRHHDTELAVRGQCTYCHDPAWNPYTNPERDCKVCHIEGGPLGNLGNPHHKSQYADAGSCTACHDSTLVTDVYAVVPPQFDPTSITPTPFSCENCHWPSGAVVNQPPPFTDWNLWTSFPKPTTWPDSLPHPAPIEANGPVLTGTINPAKAYRPVSGTEHMEEGAISTNCYWCHGTNPDTDPSWDPIDPYLIRMCENCHSIYTLHSIGDGEHTTDGIGGLGLFGGYTVSGTLDQVVVTNQKCVACHGDVIARPMPTLPVTAPVIDYLEPYTASPGADVTIYDQAGGADFGDQGPDDVVQMHDGSAFVDVPVVSWTTDRIVFTIPGWEFPTSAWAAVRVVKMYWAEDLGDFIGNDDGICDPGEACHQVPSISNAPAPGFFLRKHPVLTSLVPDSGTWGTVVTINGVANSFYSSRESFGSLGASPQMGQSTYVELVASNDRYRVTEMTGSGWAGDAALGAWSDTQIQIRLMARAHPNPAIGIIGNLLDVNTGNYVPLADLYKGNWQLYVITDYFRDDGAIPNQYMLKIASGHLTGKMDNDTLLYREISDPLPFFATDTPFVSTLKPTVVKGGSLIALYGINFGTTQDTSYVVGGACGSPFTPVYTFPASSVVQWANTRIVLRTPVVGATKVGCLQVRVPKVQAPGSTDSNLSPVLTVTP